MPQMLSVGFNLYWDLLSDNALKLLWIFQILYFFCKPCLIYQNIFRYLEGRGWKVRWIPGVSRKLIEIICTVKSYTIWPGTCIKTVDKVNFDFMLIMVSCAWCLFLVKTQCLFHLDSAGLEYLLMSLTFSARGSKCFYSAQRDTKTFVISGTVLFALFTSILSYFSTPALHSNSFLFLNMYIITS